MPPNEYGALLPIIDDGSIAGCKRLLNGYGLQVIKWQAPDTYHVTVCFGTGEPESDAALLPDVKLPIAIEAEGIDQFETPDGYAIHLRVKRTPELAALQKSVYASFGEQGLELSPHSLPQDYHPHITLCYSATPLADPLVIEPFTLVAHNITLSGADRENIAMKRYNDISELPQDVQQSLTPDEQQRFLAAFNAAFEETGDEHKSFLAGYGAINRARVMSRKSASGAPIVEGWGMLFTDEDNLDSWNTYFSEITETFDEYYQNAPLWMEHGYDPDYGQEPIGRRCHLEVFRRGIWVEHELHPEHALFDRTVEGVERGIFSYSSDSIQHYMEQGFAPNGELRVWPLAGWSLTRNPAEPGLGPVTVKKFATALKAQRQREAARDDATTPIVQLNPTSKGQSIMDPTTIQNLADMLGVEPTQEAVVAALQQLLASLQSEAAQAATDDAEEVAGVPMKAAREALGLEDKTGAKATVAKFIEFIEGVLPKPVTINFDAMKKASEAAENTPREDDLPHFTGSDRPASKGEKHRNFGAPSTPKVPKKARANVAAALSLIFNEGGKPSARAMKTLGYTIGPNAGWMPDREVSNELIELFYAQTVTLEAGATKVPMDGIETLDYRKVKGGATADYGALGQSPDESQMQFGYVSLNLKWLRAATRINNRLLRNASVALENIIKADLEKSVALRADLAHLRGTGAKTATSKGAEPLGVKYTPDILNNRTTSLGTNGANPTILNFVQAWGKIEDANVPLSDSWGIVASPRTLRFMENQRDTTGRKLDDSEWTNGHNTFKTTQVPNNLTVGSSSDCSEVYVGAWEYLVVGVGLDVEFIVSTEKYIAEGDTYVQVNHMHDCGVSHPEAFQVLTGVRGSGV